MTILYVLAAVAAVFFAFQINVWAGIALVAIILGAGIYYYIPRYYAARGNQAYAAGDDEAAYRWYKKAIETGRASVMMKSSYAYTLMRTGREDEAEKVLDPIIRVKSLDPKKRNLAKQQRCMVYYRQGRIDEAIEDVQALFEEGYVNSAVHGMLGYFMLLRGDDLDETLKVCEEAYDYNKDNRDILDNLAICYYRLGRYEDAERISDELLENCENFVEGCYHGAQIAVALGKYDRADELLEEISDCKRSAMTTVTEEQIEELKKEIKSKKK